MTYEDDQIMMVIVKKIAVAKFKATCLSVMDQVAQTGEPVEVTKRGKPLVRLVPIRRQDRTSLFGAARQSITYLAPDEELFSTGVVWNADR